MYIQIKKYKLNKTKNLNGLEVNPALLRLPLYNLNNARYYIQISPVKSKALYL